MTPNQAQDLADQRGYRPLPAYTNPRIYADGDRIFAIRQALTAHKPRDPNELPDRPREGSAYAF